MMPGRAFARVASVRFCSAPITSHSISKQVDSEGATRERCFETYCRGAEQNSLFEHLAA
jgi:hypothetical protein